MKLPTIEPRGALTRAPQSSVSGADVANTYEYIAQGFNAIGQTMEAKRLDDARIEGQQAVSRDEQGNLSVSLKSNISESGRVHNRFASQAFLAREEVDAKQRLARLQEDANGDPDAFRASAKAYRDERMTNTPKELRGPVGTMLEGEIGLSQIGVEKQRLQIETTMNKSALLAALTEKDNDRSALARGGGIGTPEYEKAYSETRTLWKELTSNPRFQISDREAEIRLKAAADRDVGEALLGEADRALDSGGVAEAQRLADDVLTRSDVSLSGAKRRQLSGLIRQSIKSYRAEERAAVQSLKDVARDRMKEWDAGVGLDSAEDAMLIEDIRRGDPSYATYLTSRLTAARQVRDIRNLSDVDQVKLLEHARGKFSPEEAETARTFLQSRTDKDSSHITGLDDTFAVKVARLLQAAPPEIRDKLGIYSGARSNERQAQLFADAVKRYGSEAAARKWVAPPGKSNHNHGMAADLSYDGQSLKNAPADVVKWLHDNAEAYGLKFPLGNENWHVEDSSTRGGNSSPLVGQAAKTLQSEVTSDLRRDLPQWGARLNRGDVPDQQAVDLMERQLALVDDQDLRSQYQTMFRNSEAFQQAFRDNPAALESFLGSLDARASGTGASLAEYELMDSARAGAEAAAALKKSDGLGYAIRAYPNFPELPLLDVNDPGSYENTLRQYQSAVNIAQARGELSNVPAFRPAQAEAVARMWQRGDPDQLNALTSAMASTLSPETLRATLTDKAIKEALSGAILSNDPVKHSTAMQQLDLLAARSSMPEMEAAFGKDAVDRLQDWQAKVRYFTADETAEWLKQRNDPKWEERVTPLVRKGEAEARKVDPADIVEKLDTNSWFDAGGPVDSDTQRMMLNDYVSLVGERNASLNDIDKAKTQAIERMQKVWGVTSVYGDRGGRVMPYPPEGYYPAVGSSHDWLGLELQEIAAARSVPAENLSLVADRKTQDAAMRGEAPGYLISIIDPETGMHDLMRDENGRELRHFFDPEAAQRRAAAEAVEARRTRNDPWMVLGKGTAIGPLYLGGADEADLQNRDERIMEILGERRDRLEQKRQTREILKRNGIPGEN